MNGRFPTTLPSVQQLRPSPNIVECFFYFLFIPFPTGVIVVRVLLFAQHLIIKTSQGKSLWVSKILLNKKGQNMGDILMLSCLIFTQRKAVLWRCFTARSQDVRPMWPTCFARMSLSLFTVPFQTAWALLWTILSASMMAGHLFLMMAMVTVNLKTKVDILPLQNVQVFLNFLKSFCKTLSAWVLIRCDPTFIVCNVLSYP